MSDRLELSASLGFAVIRILFVPYWAPYTITGVSAEEDFTVSNTMPKRPAKDVCADQPEPKHRRRTSTSKQDKLANGSSEKSGPVKRPGASHKTKGAGRTLTRSVRQGGLLETLILGDQPEETVRRLWSDAEDVLLRQAIKRIGA